MKKTAFTCSLIVLLVISCEKNIQDDSRDSAPSAQTRKKLKPSEHSQDSTDTLSGSEQQESSVISDLDVKKAINRSIFLVENGDRTPNSRDSEELEQLIFQLLRSGESAAYEVISKLPPGYYSEAIVANVFGLLKFDSVEKIVEISSQIKDKDFHRAALSAACSSMILRSQRAESPPLVTKEQALSMRQAGLPKQGYDLLLVHGLRVGSIAANEIINEISSDSNTLLIAALNEASVDVSKDLLKLAINNKKPVDLGSVKSFALRLQRDDSAQAVEWFVGLGSSEFGAAGVESIFREWLAADPLTASSFIKTMSPGSERDAAVASVVRDCMKNGDIATGTSWSHQVSSVELREKLQKVLNQADKR